MILVKPLFVASIASLTLMMTTIASTVQLLQQMGILPAVGTCSNCSSSTGSYKSEGLYNYFRCSYCKKKQSVLQNTVLSNSNTTLHDFVLLMYQFCNSHRTYDTVAKETFLPQDGYKETHLSRNTINKWFSYFRLLCMRAQKKVVTKIGGEGDIVEMDETMCGKCKYGLGDGRKRRRAWVFGGVSRLSGRLFMCICPENKRTRKALWPIIQANVAPKTMLHTDGWRAYRRLPELGYGHCWVDHSKNYVDPTDKSLHTNRIEGLWNKFKKWLPQAGNYNLEEYIYLFMWMEEQKQLGHDPFWALVALVAADNNLDTLKEATTRQEKVDAEEVYDDEDEDESDEEDEDEYEDTDDEDLELFHFFDCIGCKAIFRDQAQLLQHTSTCDNL